MTDTPDRALARYKRPLRYVMGLNYVVVGILHLLVPTRFEQVVPPQLPRPLELVYLSGVVEIVLGLGVLFERTRRAAAVGIMLLLAAVFPANVYMAVSDVELQGVPAWARDPPDALLWARLPLQAVLVLWAYWYTDERSEN
ncbi:MAG: hypothetical protein ABEJ05_08625 [Haloglomus sp.]